MRIDDQKLFIEIRLLEDIAAVVGDMIYLEFDKFERAVRCIVTHANGSQDTIKLDIIIYPTEDNPY